MSCPFRCSPRRWTPSQCDACSFLNCRARFHRQRSSRELIRGCGSWSNCRIGKAEWFGLTLLYRSLPVVMGVRNRLLADGKQVLRNGRALKRKPGRTERRTIPPPPPPPPPLHPPEPNFESMACALFTTRWEDRKRELFLTSGRTMPQPRSTPEAKRSMCLPIREALLPISPACATRSRGWTVRVRP